MQKLSKYDRFRFITDTIRYIETPALKRQYRTTPIIPVSPIYRDNFDIDPTLVSAYMGPGNPRVATGVPLTRLNQLSKFNNDF